MNANTAPPTPDEVARWIDGLAEWDRNRDGWSPAYSRLRDHGAAAIPALRDGLRHANGRVRTCAVYLLAEHGPAAACALGDLIGLLEDASARVRRAAIGAIIRLGDAGREAAPRLVERLNSDSDLDARILAARALEFLDSPHIEAIEALVRVFDHPCPVLRGVAAVTAGKLAPGNEVVAQRLEENFILDDMMRPAWAVGLARCASERLVRLAVHNPDVFWAGDKLGDSWHRREREQHSTLHRVHRELIQPTSCTAILMRLAALGAEAAPVRRVFVEMLATPSREAALYALGRIGAGAFDTIPAIARTTDLAAREALRSILFGIWHEEEQLAELHPTRWRERMIDRFRARWQREPIPLVEQETIEQVVSRGTRADILSERLKAGDVSRERVELAALLWDRPARHALGLPDSADIADIPDLKAFRAWEVSFAPQPLEVRVRIGQAVARDVLPLWRRVNPDACMVTRSLHTLENWITSPPSRRADVERFRDGIHGPEDPWGSGGVRYWRPGHGDEFASAARAVLDPGLQLFHECPEPRCGLWEALWAWDQHAAESPLHYFDMAPSLNALVAGREVIPHVRRVVRASVVPWALGEADPVCEPLTRVFATVAHKDGES